MSYEHCEKHDCEATNGCELCATDDVIKVCRQIVMCEGQASRERRIRQIHVITNDLIVALAEALERYDETGY